MRRSTQLRRPLVAFALGLAALGLIGACDDRDLPGGGGAGGEGSGFQGLSAPVDLVRDTEGVVHVYGATDADAFYGSGYAQARDRLFQMDLMRRQVLGRKAEVLGQGAVEGDRLLRTLRMGELGEANAKLARESTPESYALVEAWTAGVNARIAEVSSGEAPMPEGFRELGYTPEPWNTTDAFTIGKAIVFQNGNQLEYDLLATLIDRYQPGLLEKVPFFTPIEDSFIVPRTSTRQADEPQAQPRPAAGRERTPLPYPADAHQRLRDFVERMAIVRPGASNNWAVSGAHTESGKSLLAGDPHQPLRSPSLMWVHQLNSADRGGSLDVVGWSFVGTPAISIGHNRKLAWTATTSYPDVTDIYDVEVTTTGELRFGGELFDLDVREQTILVKDGDPVTLRLEAVPGLGVLLPEGISPLPITDVGRRLFFVWTGFSPTREASAFFEFDRAEDLDAFDRATDTMELGSFNFVAATADATTYRSSPAVPIRPDPMAHPPYFVLDGDAPETRWSTERLAADQLPHERNPARGYSSSANNDPFGFTADGDPTNDDYYFGSFFDPGTRAKRVELELERLVTRGEVSLDDMKALQSDTHSRLADQLLPLLFEAWSRVESEPELAGFRDRPELDELAAVLESWDRRVERDRPGALAFEAFWAFYARAALADDMSLFFSPVFDSSPMYVAKLVVLASRDPESAVLQEGRDVLLLTALADTASWLESRWGSSSEGYAWSDFHITRFRSESTPTYDGGSVPSDGGEGTINVSSARFLANGEPVETHSSGSGAIYRMVASFDDDGTPRAYFNLPRGNVGEPSSPYFDDRTADWVEDRYTLLRFKADDVEAGSVERVVLAP
jgi:penicillin G amidase